MENNIKRVVNTSPDKREMQLNRESIKAVILILIGVLLMCVVYPIFYRLDEEQTERIMQQRLQQQKESYVINLTKKTTKPKVNYKDLCVVLKVSKDVKKYFISYKKYYTNDKFNVIIDEISFREYMLLSANDTITNTKFNQKIVNPN